MFLWLLLTKYSLGQHHPRSGQRLSVSLLLPLSDYLLCGSVACSAFLELGTTADHVQSWQGLLGAESGMGRQVVPMLKLSLTR
jgi:hypothetical protein